MTSFTLTGTITDDASQPAPVKGVKVELFLKDTSKQKWGLYPVATANTDANGNYTLTATQAGTYKIQPNADNTDFDPPYLSHHWSADGTGKDFTATTVARNSADQVSADDILFVKSLLAACRESFDGWVVEMGSANATEFVRKLFAEFLAGPDEICIPLPVMGRSGDHEERKEIVELWHDEQKGRLQEIAEALLSDNDVGELENVSCSVCKAQYYQNHNYSQFVYCMTQPVACYLP